MKITLRPSPNFNERKGPLDMLVLHYTGMETGDAAIERLCDPEAGVSAHYVVRENGDILKLVDEDKRAWHAGVASWQGDEDLNSRSVGIEIVNGGHDWPAADGSLPAYPDAQIEAVTELALGIIERWSIPQTRVVGHSDVAPARKADPGEHFPWQQLAASHIGLWPHEAGDASQPVPTSLKTIGYDIGDLKAAITAFQRRWLQHRTDGLDDGEVRARASAVAKLYSAG
ncbi:MAG TPA: N-acetylmuramoyl-L-alanine amidase [Henriciella marina]|uniref:N-acetylmuramoyl-L-alanine amidase n=1 Tax=Henriciella sp. TaxID=1968823 RepID=UPI0017C8629B|nr:N-acetylmuramoyl-L-alanine amidase [Henriciella sp.]HIG23728.1 N-acetylmuramoyl-L-alanine amidase [Henriciella sp.]HIK63844.1 N-acetylmuramoyl-L-alanine amidase [Henriciella marina]